MPRPKKYETKGKANAASKKANTDRIVYDLRKDAKYNKDYLKVIAAKLHNGSLTALLDAAIEQYIDGIHGLPSSPDASDHQEDSKD